MLDSRLRTVLLAAIFLAPIRANWNDTSTGIDLTKLPQFAVTKVRSGQLTPGKHAAFDGIAATAGSNPKGVRLRGTGRSGKRWVAHIAGIDEVWRGDLDANGTQDYVLFGGGPYFNGRVTPLFSFSILLFDPEGLPVPFFTAIYHDCDDGGIKHLVDLNRDGHAELLIPSYDENVSDPRVGPFCSGYWTTQLYRFHALGAEAIRGTFAGMEFPFVHPWTYRGTECSVGDAPYPPIEPLAIHDQGTSTQRIQTTKIRSQSDGVLTIGPVLGCTAIEPAVVVYDRPQIREIAFPILFTSYAAKLTGRIQKDRAAIELRGIEKRAGNGVCHVNLLWAN